MLKNSAEAVALSANRLNNHHNNHQPLSLFLDGFRQQHHHQFNDKCDFCSVDSSRQLVAFDPVSDPSKVHGHHGKTQQQQQQQQLRCSSGYVSVADSVATAGGRFPLQTFAQGMFTQTLINDDHKIHILKFSIVSASQLKLCKQNWPISNMVKLI